MIDVDSIIDDDDADDDDDTWIIYFDCLRLLF